MKQLQAAMKDSSWRRSRGLPRIAYRVGGFFKGCLNCGEQEETDRGIRYRSGYQVWRSWSPQQTGWTYWCYECGSKDLQCWEGADDIGQPPVRGARDVVAAIKREQRQKSGAGASKPRTPRMSMSEMVAKIEKFLAEQKEAVCAIR